MGSAVVIYSCLFGACCSLVLTANIRNRYCWRSEISL